MKERTGLATVDGNPLTLVGEAVTVGEKAPDFKVLDINLNPVSPSNFKGRPFLISSVPSLDTSVCDRETRRFNEEAAGLDPEIAILTISMDLPPAQKRWCGAAGISRVQTLSDHREASFGYAYGVLIKELRLLARAVFAVDRSGFIRYEELVREMSDEPDYEAVLTVLKELL